MQSQPRTQVDMRRRTKGKLGLVTLFKSRGKELIHRALNQQNIDEFS